MCWGAILYVSNITLATILRLCAAHINILYLHVYLSSKVSHHPPAAAHHVISQRGWTLWQEITIASKFRGKYLSIMPLGKTCYAQRRSRQAVCK